MASLLERQISSLGRARAGICKPKRADVPQARAIISPKTSIRCLCSIIAFHHQPGQCVEQLYEAYAWAMMTPVPVSHFEFNSDTRIGVH